MMRHFLQRSIHLHCYKESLKAQLVLFADVFLNECLVAVLFNAFGINSILYSVGLQEI